MAKQTAVQFLVMKYNQWQGVLKDRDIEEAKAIEKEQIEQAYIQGAEMAKGIFKEELKNVFVLPKNIDNENNK